MRTTVSDNLSLVIKRSTSSRCGWLNLGEEEADATADAAAGNPVWDICVAADAAIVIIIIIYFIYSLLFHVCGLSLGSFSKDPW